ncbi:MULTISPECIES: 2-C-methyl-D-erythritol 4-phosphate cytidylyltransferase [Cellvibrio]|uniref:2-C-methyl-D-erythritol 4-phosphate cytidylyltransferase n=1 Tax=Cellvibrio fibrivorans TaxID=126350 RepID=A0ABU1UY42_9GAMM|nr:2-C-methyl-D-erythritol 4-phosphate cytidylyltransferase [Cellvibrio fibrivorans]MDR7090104.1 2-C-methyl-D-erythritol 4-phosphate cytidylyltransferase [Cellvibrio fibrivorans]
MNHSSSPQSPAYWIVVPAAGVGARMGADCPKQYLPLVGKTVIEHTLERLLALPNIAGIYLVLGADDNYWNDLSLAQNNRIQRVAGGAERCDSVLNALEQLFDNASPNDWVLVHDAARPCVHVQSVLHLIEQVKTHPVGGILGVPVSDTLKQVNNSIIDSTVDRRLLWQAQTPQMFRLGLLRDCLQRGLAEGKLITDESSALESYGYQPLMVQGRSDNIKITRPEDLAIAAMLLQQQI